MTIRGITVAAAVIVSAGSVHADDSALILGKSVYNALCTNCHGADGKGGGDVGDLFANTPPDLTTLTKQSDGTFPFAHTYDVIISGIAVPGHGPLEMPVWGDYFMADTLIDRGMNEGDAIYAAVGRALSVTYYLESIQD